MRDIILLHYIFKTHSGYSAILFSDNPLKIVRILLPCSNKKRLQKEIINNKAGIEGTHPKIVLLAESIQDYFSGKNRSFSSGFEKWMDYCNLTELERFVLQATSRIPYGETASYKDIAKAVGRPEACRFVGNTLSKNPFPILIPCHRVIKSNGSFGGFGGGRDLKIKMLALEQH
ncbi:MAG: MGMT family protein [Pseudomonadota bacterium]